MRYSETKEQPRVLQLSAESNRDDDDLLKRWR
jgi:hypothetical protein